MRVEALGVQEALYAEETPLCGEETLYAERRLHCAGKRSCVRTKSLCGLCVWMM